MNHSLQTIHPIMAYTLNCANCHQRDQQFISWIAQLRVYLNGDDVIQDMFREESSVQEACPACEDKFDLLNETGEEKIKRKQHPDQEGHPSPAIIRQQLKKLDYSTPATTTSKAILLPRGSPHSTACCKTQKRRKKVDENQFST